jgi:hypothetical protein
MPASFSLRTAARACRSWPAMDHPVPGPRERHVAIALCGAFPAPGGRNTHGVRRRLAHTLGHGATGQRAKSNPHHRNRTWVRLRDQLRQGIQASGRRIPRTISPATSAPGKPAIHAVSDRPRQIGEWRWQKSSCDDRTTERTRSPRSQILVGEPSDANRQIDFARNHVENLIRNVDPQLVQIVELR